MNKAWMACALLAVALPAQARNFCCEANGRMYCDEGVPAACQGKAYREVNSRGVTVQLYEAPLTPQQVAQREAEAAKKREEQQRLAAQEKRDRILLSSYASTAEVDQARDRAVADIEKLKKQSEQHLGELQAKKKHLDNEAEFHKKNGLPESLKSQLRELDTDTKAQQKSIEARMHEIDVAKARFEEDKRRYVELTGKSADDAKLVEVPRSTR